MPPRAAAVTIVDVARAARVSRTTASAALGGTGRISEATREHVATVARELGYVANPAARHLQRGRRGAIGLYVPDNLSGFAFYMELAMGAAAAARDRGFGLMLLPRIPAQGGPGPAAHVDGFLMVDPLVGDPSVPVLLDAQLPAVAAERYLDDARQPPVTVETDHRGAVADLLDHLWARGARSPALLNLDIDIAWTRLVDEVYLAWCGARGVRPRLRRLPTSGDPAAVLAVTRALLAEPGPPDALVSAPDGTALSALGAARAAGRAVGEDFLVASCVDSLPMRFASPPITAIDLRPREIGHDGATVLLRLIDGEALPPSIRRGRPELAVRASTGGARA